MAAKQEFESRFAKHKDELEWLFMELYHNREGLEVLEREMAEAYNARSAELKALDKARSADPEWYKRGNMFGMTMYTDLFAGNLKELAKKLPYLKEQNLTYLHLMPLLQMPHPHNDGGYAVEDFDTVDPVLGTNKDLENLTRELRKAGISLCLDFVMNHTASTHRWAMAAKAGDPCFALDAWVTTWDSHNPGVLALVRKRNDETLVGLFNFTEYPAGASLDALGGKYTTADGKTVWLADVELQPYQALLVRR